MSREYLSQSEYCLMRSRQAETETERTAWMEMAGVWLKVYLATNPDDPEQTDVPAESGMPASAVENPALASAC